MFLKLEIHINVRESQKNMMITVKQKYKNTIFGFLQSVQNYLKVTVGNTKFILTKDDRIPLSDTTVIEKPNKGGFLSQSRKSVELDILKELLM